MGTVTAVAFDDPLAEALEAEAACVWHDWAGALLVVAAACVAGSSSNRIVLQRGHAVDIGGGSIPGLLRLPGAEPVEAGAVDLCRLEELRGALAAPGTSAGLFVLGPSLPAGLVDLPRFAWACREAAGHRSWRSAAGRHRRPPRSTPGPTSSWPTPPRRWAARRSACRRPGLARAGLLGAAGGAGRVALPRAPRSRRSARPWPRAGASTPKS
jgi:hypothetical protein